MTTRRVKLNEHPSPSSYLQDLTRRLASLSETPALDAQVLLAHILDRTRASILAHPEIELDSEQRQAVESALRRLEAGEPLPYVLGRWEFYGLPFELTPDVLIPRPETELLIEQALAWLQAHPRRNQVADVGTGSGCIAIALAAHRPDLQILATDLSALATQVANRNARLNGVSPQIEFRQGDLLSSMLNRFDLICANLPYIPTETLQTLAVYGREPSLALDGGPDGLDLIRRLLAQAPDRLAPDGCLLLEIEASQGPEVLQLARQTFPSAQSQVLPDLAGWDRLARIQLPDLEE